MYVNVNFTLGGTIVDDYSVIESLNDKYKRCVVSGTAGSGKTVFMKYLFVSLYENPQGKIPIFFELRSLNVSEVRDVLNNIYYSVFHSPKHFTLEELHSLASDGAFHFILDGYDEINFNIRPEIEKSILHYADKYDKCNFIVSGRPDESFRAWELFSVLRAKPIDRKQAIELISKLEYDSDAKKEFISLLKKEEFDRFRELLSTPLMVTMMFLAHQTGAKIPKKLHLFYDLVFHALYERHDGIKQSFKRVKYCELAIDLFADVLATFCFMTCRDQKYEFQQDELLKYLRDAILFTNAEVDADGFRRDLIESVCILQKDGIAVSFVHRSFQEYFAARFIDRVRPASLPDFVKVYSGMMADNALKLLFGMNSRLVEAKWLLNDAIKLCAELEQFDSENQPVECAKIIWGGISITRMSERPYFFVQRTSPHSTTHSAMSMLYKEEDSLDSKKYQHKDEELFKRVLKPSIDRKDPIWSAAVAIRVREFVKQNNAGRDGDQIQIETEDNFFVIRSGIGAFINDEKRFLLTTLSEMKERVGSWERGPP